MRKNIHSETSSGAYNVYDNISEGTKRNVFSSEFPDFNNAERQADTQPGLLFGVVLVSLVCMVVFISVLTIAEEPKDDLDYWLQRAKPAAESQPTTLPDGSTNQESVRNELRTLPTTLPVRRDDALPGVIEFSDGAQLAGWMYGTRDNPWRVWVADEKRWRRIPPAAVLSITAVVDQEEMKLRWRWKAMGEPEKVYTGKKYPFRRFRWRFRLADGSQIVGAVKGQPLWIEITDKAFGPYLLQERAKGKDGQSPDELVYIRKVVVSRRMMRAVRKARTEKR